MQKHVLRNARDEQFLSWSWAYFSSQKWQVTTSPPLQRETFLVWLKNQSAYFATWMPAAAGWGAAQGQVSPGGKFVPFRSSFHCNPCPGGEAAQTAEPFWCLAASLLPSCSLPAGHCLFNAFKPHNLLSLLCCSSTWIMGAKKKAGNRARTKHRERAGVGGESRNSRSLHLSCSRQVCAGRPHREFGKGRALHDRETTPWATGSECLGPDFISGYCPHTKGLSCSWDICPHLAVLATLCGDVNHIQVQNSMF